MAKLRLFSKQLSHIKKMWKQVRKLNGTYSFFTASLLTAPGVQTSLGEHADIWGNISLVFQVLRTTQKSFQNKNTAEKQTLPTYGGTNEAYYSLITLKN